MKAYIVRLYGEFVTVVFADSAGKARSFALHTVSCRDSNFTDIQVLRLYKADCLYRGKIEMDWSNPQDRLFLVTECGFSCHELNYMECIVCSSKYACHKFFDFSGIHFY